MNGGGLPLSDAIAETVSGGSCHLVLETSPPDYVQKISRFLESSVGQSSQDPASRDSDSGDSLFLTQNLVSEPVRSHRRRPFTLDPTSPSGSEDSEEDEQPTDPHRENTLDRRRKKCRLPKYSFPFLKERKWKPRSTRLFGAQNVRLHNSGMGGFFKCVRELSQSRRRGGNLESSLPTVDTDGEEISPLLEREEEEEGSDSEDIKVVERKCFVVLSSKAKRPQPWNTPQTAGGRRRRTEPERPAEASQPLRTPCAASTGHAEASSSALVDSGTRGEHTESRVTVVQTETRGSHGHGDSDGTPGPEEERRAEQSTPVKRKKKKRRRINPEVDNSEDGQEDQAAGLESDTRRMKRKRSEKGNNGEHKADDEQLTPKPMNGDAQVGRKRQKETILNPGDTMNLTLDQLEEAENRLEITAAPQDALDAGYQNSKTHKKNKSCQDATEEEEGEDMGASNDTTLPGKKKKKKKKSRFSIDNGVVTLDTLPEETQKTSEDKDAESVTKKKKKKKKKKKLAETWNIPDAEQQSHDSVSAREEEGTSSFLAADAQGKDKSTPPRPVAAGNSDPATESAGTARGPSAAGPDGGGRKKKRKRRMSAKDHAPGFDEPSETGQSDSHGTADAGLKGKKERRRDASGPESPAEGWENAADEEQSQTGEAVVLKKKKKKKKKIEEDPPTNAESELTTSHENKIISTDTMSPDVVGNLTLSHLKGKKKKKKKNHTDNVSLKGESLAKGAESETKKHKKKQRKNPPAASSFTSSGSTLSETDFPPYVADSMKKNKHMRTKRRLYYQSDDILT